MYKIIVEGKLTFILLLIFQHYDDHIKVTHRGSVRGKGGFPPPPPPEMGHDHLLIYYLQVNSYNK